MIYSSPEVTNKYEQSETGGSPRPPTIRVGDMKLILGNPGDDRVVQWPELSPNTVPFGRSNGTRDVYDFEKAQNLQHCRAPHPNGPKTQDQCQYNGCLFNVTADESESVNLINQSKYETTTHTCTRTRAYPILASPLAMHLHYQCYLPQIRINCEAHAPAPA